MRNCTYPYTTLPCATYEKSDDEDGDTMIRAVLMSSEYALAGRVIKLEVAKEAGDLHDRCIPRKPKGKKDGWLPGHLLQLQRAGAAGE